MHSINKRPEDKLITRNMSTSSASTDNTVMEADVAAEDIEKESGIITTGEQSGT